MTGMQLQEFAMAVFDDTGIIPGDIVQHVRSCAKPGAFWIPSKLIWKKYNGRFLW